MNQIPKARALGVAVLFLAAAAVMQAAPIQATITFENPSIPSLGDGSFFVGPALIEINTGSGNTPQMVVCYDTHDDANVGDTWTANLFNLTDAANLGYFSVNLAGYEKVAWLSAQEVPASDIDRIGLQEAIWSVFGNATVLTDPNAVAEDASKSTYLANVAAAALGGYSGFDFSHFVFVEQVGGVAGSTDPRSEQAFVYNGTIPTTTHQTQLPEPGTFVLAGGIGLLGLIARRKARA